MSGSYTIALSGARFVTPAPACPGDVDESGDVGFGDILAIIGAWGPCPGCPADVNGDGFVNFADILLVIASWTP